MQATRDETASGVLATFLAERVELARRGDIQGADLTERLTNALDYRYWYSFKLKYNQSGVDSELTAKTVGSGSGGQQAKVGHLPLLAAAAGFYSSSKTAPRLCFLDEAFAGIDSPNTADLLEVTVTLDLDMVMTNYDAWFCVPQVPGLAIYHLEKISGTYGVAAIRYEYRCVGTWMVHILAAERSGGGGLQFRVLSDGDAESVGDVAQSGEAGRAVV
ncbi:MAG: SbcC/MukB-like Walker B domain-containing protein, partial [Nocardioidaceae bacterium]